MNYKYKHANLGGSFDHLHKGHKAFLDAALKDSENVTIGLATDKLFGKKEFPNALLEYEVRKTELENYLKEKDYSPRSTIIAIDDIYGNTLTEENIDPDSIGIDALFVTEDVFKNAQKLNEERLKNGLNELELVMVPEVMAEDGLPISSTRIRGGEMDREGALYIKMFEQTLSLPESMRDQLSKPFGEVLKNDEIKKMKSIFLIAIGDIVATTFIKLKKQANISLFDLKTKRKEVSRDILDLLPDPDAKITNMHGTIQGFAVGEVYKQIHESIDAFQKKVIEVDGEEDLLALPAILLSPLGGKVAYGLPDKGVVVIDVTEEKKNDVKKLVEKFDRVRLIK